LERAGLDLRGGTTLWEVRNRPSLGRPLTESTSADILIIGAGITGSFLAERLFRSGRPIIVLDRNQPHTASTAASTALLLWAIDTPLRDLTERIGFDRAAEVYRANVAAVELEIVCHCTPRPSLFLTGDKMSIRDLVEEQRLREKAGIASTLVAAKPLAESLGFRRDGALHDEGCAEADPVALANGLLGAAIRRGVRVFAPVSVVEYDVSARGTTVLTDTGLEVEGKDLVLANGYEMPSIVPSSIHEVISTWVVATPPNMNLDWPDGMLVWEASSPYLYMRRTSDGRIIVGGEDEQLTDADERDRLIDAKSRTLLEKLADLRPLNKSAIAEYAWSGFFGVTRDGLPLIGRLSNSPHVYAAFGYGGNGITSSAIAAKLISELMEGHGTNGLLESFALSR
jgi:glycine/D-amino acid oxidase-like deaminating enzyme